MGRPRSDDPKSERAEVRLTVSERKKLDDERGGLSLSDHIRAKLFGR